MGIFSTGHQQDFHKLSERVAELERTVLLLQTTLKCAKTEWDDILDKITKQTERMRKRAAVFAQDAQEGQENEKPILSDPHFRQHLLAEMKSRGQA